MSYYAQLQAHCNMKYEEMLQEKRKKKGTGENSDSVE